MSAAPSRAGDSRPAGHAPLLEARGLTYAYPGSARDALREVSLRVAQGSLVALVGPNGSGKSTLLRLLLGALRPRAGEVLYRGRRVRAWGRRALARRIGVVPQIETPVFPVTVCELVEMGRYPHLGLLGRAGEADRRAVTEALAACDVGALADRPLETLSGGERQRARIARALAQQPETLVLDEPTISLDLEHEMAIFELARRLPARGVGVLLVTHNLNLAARYAERVLVLEAGRLVADGAPAEVLLRPLLERVYRWPVSVQPHPGPGPDAGAPQVVPLSGESSR